MISLENILNESLFDDDFGVDPSRMEKFINILDDMSNGKYSISLNQAKYNSGLSFDELVNTYIDFRDKFCNKIQKSKINKNDWYTCLIDTRCIIFKGGLPEKLAFHWHVVGDVQVIEMTVHGKGGINMYEYKEADIYRQTYKVNKYMSKKLDTIWKEKYTNISK